MVSTIAVEIVRVDKDTLKLLKYPLHVWPETHEAMLKQVEGAAPWGRGHLYDYSLVL
jgi:hypothetical protein